MQPGSLIFLVIVAVWAVYLVQHWIRRRDHLATARSVDRFSDAMRVLERRAAPAVGAPQGLYAASPAAPRPTAARPALVGRRAGDRDASCPVTSGAGASTTRTARPAAPARAAARPTPGRPSLAARRVRGVVVLAALLALPTTVLLSAFGALGWVSVLVALGALAVVVAWTRASVRREQAVRRAARVAERRRVRPPRVAQPAAPRTAAPQTGATAPRVAAEAGAAEPAASEPVTAATPEASRSDRPAVYDLDAVDDAARAAQAAAAFAQEWSPVPVPTPTYMLKDSAPRTVPEWDDAPSAGGAVPVPIEVEDDELDQLMAARHRRIVG